MVRLLLRILVVSLVGAIASAQIPPEGPGPPVGAAPEFSRGTSTEATPEPVLQQPAGSNRQWTDIEVYLSVALLVFALLVLGLQTIMVAKAKVEWHPKSILRMMGLTLIIAGGLFLITAGYSVDQVSPMMGLLGTIAGYLLGAGEAPT